MVISFIQNHILYRFEILETITTDQGSIFIGRKMVDFANQTSFKLLTSMPYYAQANGQVEVANKIIIELVKKHTYAQPINWHKTSNQILWACPTSQKKSTNSTTFRLAFSHDAVLLVEICVQAAKVQRQLEIPTNQYWNMMLDELVNLDEDKKKMLQKI